MRGRSHGYADEEETHHCLSAGREPLPALPEGLLDELIKGPMSAMAPASRPTEPSGTFYATSQSFAQGRIQRRPYCLSRPKSRYVSASNG